MLQKLVFPDAELYLQGAHLTRFKDWLYLSSSSHFLEGKSIRGGIPVVFPWFGPKRDDTNAPQHGWARTSLWQIETQSESDVVLSLSHDDWRIRLRYEFGDVLTVHVTVQNLGHVSRSFELALHSYFAVDDVAALEIEGLDGLTYLDKTRSNERFRQDGAVRFAGEVDRIYLGAPSPFRIREAGSSYRLDGNWKSAVTWNPGAVKAATMNDIGEGEWKNFVCLEVGAMADDAVELAPQETWSMGVTVSKI